ncbi:MAG: hypothetical protein ACQESR_11425 [Planctomycetota bacterium]
MGAGTTLCYRRQNGHDFTSAEVSGLPEHIFQAVGFFRVESGPTQAVLPLVGLGGGESHP